MNHKTCALFCILSLIIILIPQTFAQKQLESPRLQILHGVQPTDVLCKDGTVPVLKIDGKSTACVRSSTATHLLEIDWGVKLHHKANNFDGFDMKNILNSTKPYDFSLAFLLNTRSAYYEKNLDILAKNLHSGDYLFIITHSKLNMTSQLVMQAKSKCVSGVHVSSVLLYSKLSSLISETSRLPSGIDWIIYDYENGDDFSPEFSTNETVSMVYFDKAWESVKQYNERTNSHAKFMVTPPYGELKPGNWDWGKAATHMDGIDIQTQRLVKDMNTFQSHIIPIAAQLQKQSPETFSMIQFSLRPSVTTTQSVITGIGSVQNFGFDAFLIFYDQYSQNLQLEDFFNHLKKSHMTG